MKQIIPIKSGDGFDGEGTIQTVNARDLHSFLGSKQDFSDWIKKRIKQYEFAENSDFVRFHKKMEANNATMIDYHLTIDMAKELSMVERNEKGKQARKYFIECERIAKDPVAKLASMEKSEVLLLASGLAKTVEDQKEQLALQAPKVEALNRLTLSDGLHNITNTAKQLDIRPKQLFNILSEQKWIYRRAGGKGWVAYQDKIQQGLLTHKVTTKEVDGMERMFEQVLVTPKGATRIAEKFLSQA